MQATLYQIRIDVKESLALQIKRKKYSDTVYNLVNYLNKKNSILICQLDAFKGFVNECENNNQVNSPLYKWTKDTINNQAKKEKYKKSFTVYVNNEQLYEKEVAQEILEAIKKINCSEITNVRLIDSNPKNNPQPPKKYF